MRYLKGSANLFIKNRRHLRSNNLEQEKKERKKSTSEFKAAAMQHPPPPFSVRSIHSQQRSVGYDPVFYSQFFSKYNTTFLPYFEYGS